MPKWNKYSKFCDFHPSCTLRHCKIYFFLLYNLSTIETLTLRKRDLNTIDLIKLASFIVYFSTSVYFFRNVEYKIGDRILFFILFLLTFYVFVCKIRWVFIFKLKISNSNCINLTLAGSMLFSLSYGEIITFQIQSTGFIKNIFCILLPLHKRLVYILLVCVL